MIKILFPLNKSVDQNYKYWISFLNKLQKKVKNKNIAITYLLLSDKLKDHINEKELINNNLNNELLSIKDIEKKYNFSFHHLQQIDLLQTSEFVYDTRDRNWYIPEHEFVVDEEKISSLNAIINLFKNKSFDFVLVDQGTDLEMSFIQRVCHKENIPFVRYLPDFGNRCFFALYNSPYTMNILDVPIGKSKNFNAGKFIQDYINGKSNNIYNMSDSNLRMLEPLNERSLFKRIFSKNTSSLIKILKIRIKDFYYKKIEEIQKNKYYSKFDTDKNYIFYGLHLTTESHVALHSFPFQNQLIAIEQISRALPNNYYLYVKPHPWWSHTISKKDLKKIASIPFVRILEPQISIKEIIKNSKLITTLNATTGIEALALEKPVIAFSNINSYTEYNPNAYILNNIYELPDLISKAINQKFNSKSNIDYFEKLFSISSDLRFEAERFFSEEDAEEKAEKFSHFVHLVINKVFKLES